MSVEVPWYGHATTGITTPMVRILIDPWFDDNPMASTKSDEVQADVIIVTHGHHDHLGDRIYFTSGGSCSTDHSLGQRGCQPPGPPAPPHRREQDLLATPAGPGKTCPSNCSPGRPVPEPSSAIPQGLRHLAAFR